jgi:hypothetical protein
VRGGKPDWQALFRGRSLLHCTHLNGNGFAEDSVNNTSKAGRRRPGRCRFDGRIQRFVMLGKIDGDDGVMKRSDKTTA